MPRVLRRPQAVDDVLEVWDFIAEDSLDQADAWVDRLDAALRRLATQPLMGRARPELADDLRSLPFERYVISYLPISDGVDVIRVLHSARDVDSAFNDK
jgi:toxin ParE1/3/4